MPRGTVGQRCWTDPQWRAVRSSSRVLLLAALEALGEASVAELAALTGRSRQSVYPHLAAMERAGVIGTSSRVVRGRKVALFRFLAERFASKVDQATGRGLREAADVSARALHDAQIRCRRWGAVMDGRPVELSRNPEAATGVRITWLDDRLRARLNVLLREVGAVLQEGCVRRKGRRTCVLLYHFPDFTAREARAALAGRASSAGARPARKSKRPKARAAGSS